MRKNIEGENKKGYGISDLILKCCSKKNPKAERELFNAVAGLILPMMKNHSIKSMIEIAGYDLDNDEEMIASDFISDKVFPNLKKMKDQFSAGGNINAYIMAQFTNYIIEMNESNERVIIYRRIKEILSGPDYEEKSGVGRYASYRSVSKRKIEYVPPRRRGEKQTFSKTVVKDFIDYLFTQTDELMISTVINELERETGVLGFKLAEPANSGFDDGDERDAVAEIPSEEVSQYKIRKLTENIMEALAPQEAELLRMKLDGLTKTEMSIKMGVSVGTVQNIEYRLTEKLAKYVSDSGFNEREKVIFANRLSDLLKNPEKKGFLYDEEGDL